MTDLQKMSLYEEEARGSLKKRIPLGGLREIIQIRNSTVF